VESEIEAEPVQKAKGKAPAKGAKKSAVQAAATTRRAEPEVSDDELSDPPESDDD